MPTEPEPPAPDPAASTVAVARALLQAYRDQDRPRAEALLADRLVFTSPQDDHIDRATYFTRCFPTADRFVEQTVLFAVEAGPEQVVLAYEYALGTGERYRNTEILTVREGRVAEIEVFFGGRVG